MSSYNRRKFLSSTAAIATVSPSLLLTGQVAWAETPVDPEDAQAKALSYVHKSPNPETVCANCQLYTGDASAEWGPCAIFPGKVVAGAGWCSAWVVKAG